jgi:DNA-binding CsgD family transcriptional regulator
MLETIREFALERLEASDEVVSIRDAHAAYFLDLAERNEFAELLPDAERVLVLLEAEHANFRVALDWLQEAGEVGQLLRLAAALGRFWPGLGHYHEGHAWLERALAQDGAEASHSRVRASALVTLGINEIYQGMHREAEVNLTEGLVGCRVQGDTFNVSLALLGLGGLATLRRDFDRGNVLLEECLASSQALPDRRLAGIMGGWALINLADIARALDEVEQAGGRLEEALRRMRSAGYTSGIIMSLGALGGLARDRGDHARAMSFYQEALGLGRGHPRTRVVASVIEAVAIVAVAVDQVERGVRLLGAAEALRGGMGLRFRENQGLVALEQALSTARAALDEETFATAWAAGRRLRPAQAVAEALAPLDASTTSSGITLTPREAEILRLLAAGLTDPAIAAALFISVRTVEHHVGRILAKLGVRTRTAAVSAAIVVGLTDPTSPSPA